MPALDTVEEEVAFVVGLGQMEFCRCMVVREDEGQDGVVWLDTWEAEEESRRMVAVSWLRELLRPRGIGRELLVLTPGAPGREGELATHLEMQGWVRRDEGTRCEVLVAGAR